MISWFKCTYFKYIKVSGTLKPIFEKIKISKGSSSSGSSTTSGGSTTINNGSASGVSTTSNGGTSSNGKSTSGSSSSSGGGSSSSRGSSSGGGSSSSGVSSSFGGNATSSPSGAALLRNETSNQDGSSTVTVKITINGKEINATENTMPVPEGGSVKYFKAEGDFAGATFNDVGIVSKDGSTLTGKDGITYTIIKAPIYVVTNANGRSIGCFLNEATGLPFATGKDEIYASIGADGQMHIHYVNAFGYFYVGTVQMNGKTITFNSEGEIVSAV
ncbi:MAG: hypothetical protein J6M92_14535 [Oribacterium sp.]|nr:hypothetical protein [Oribacterium sp.]